MNKSKLIRYLFGLILIGLMVGVSEWLGEKEIIFPEVAALILGLWVIDKKVWTISRPLIVILMTVSALFGVFLVGYSPFPMLANIALSFIFTSLCLFVTRTSLIPIISASMLPVLLSTHSWVYPLSVFSMSLILVCVQWVFEKKGLRQFVNINSNKSPYRHGLGHWIKLLVGILFIAVIPVYTGNMYFIVPPLVVTFVEFSSSSAGFRNRPVQIFFVLVVSAILGAFCQCILHEVLGFSELSTVLLLFACLFLFIEVVGEPFAPACAIALVPMIIPQQNVLLYPLQVAGGAALFLFMAMVFFLKCYRWKRAQLLVCFVPKFMRSRISKPSKRVVRLKA
ncbi:HPP family protein [Ancylomarina sp. 16SWW S1-10-2]|uniref:HPP family protein n=1 Tax=Ancylomarina sp. 16SWW S1-10-2 TaxID=2499681 RepID=UPI0012AD97A7|nr:HPP family protein [Ancylomarina sp. 16SWW S1-10-2]MRT91882.1 HPP family protein [Ancylomarina sp. 16SWW S1-10-2]